MQAQQEKMNTVGTAYTLWLSSLFLICGVHRIYNGKIFTGILWMCTFGLCGVGQLIDLILIPQMVEEHNAEYRLRQGLSNHHMSIRSEIHRIIPQPVSHPVAVAPSLGQNSHQLMIQLLKAAQARGGRLSVTQGVLDTEVGFTEVEAALKDMVKTGYVEIDNDPVTGVVMYDFKEL